MTISSCTISGNTASGVGVRAHPQKFPSPPWETHVLLAVCRAVVSMSGVAQFQSSTPRSTPTQLPMCALVFKSSHRPYGIFTCFALVFAGRRCCCLWRHSVNRELPDLLQHSCLCARSSSKVPIAPMGKCLLTCPKRFSSFNWDRSCSTRDKYVPVTPAKVPIAPMGKLLTHFLFDSRLHNCKSCLQGGGVYVSSGTVTISSCTISGNTAGDVRARCAHAHMFPSPRWENC